MNQYKLLTEKEQSELALRIAGGAIQSSCHKTRVDNFNVKLSSGITVRGAYKWGSELGEYLELQIIGK